MAWNFDDLVHSPRLVETVPIGTIPAAFDRIRKTSTQIGQISPISGQICTKRAGFGRNLPSLAGIGPNWAKTPANFGRIDKIQDHFALGMATYPETISNVSAKDLRWGSARTPNIPEHRQCPFAPTPTPTAPHLEPAAPAPRRAHPPLVTLVSRWRADSAKVLDKK